MPPSTNSALAIIRRGTCPQLPLPPSRHGILRSTAIAVLFVTSLAATTRPLLAGAIYFDTLTNWTLVTDQYRSRGAVFDSARVHSIGTNGIDGAASGSNTVAPSNGGVSIFDGKTPSQIAAQYDMSQQLYGEFFTDILFVVDNTTPAVTNSVSLLAGFDWLGVDPRETNQIVLEAFDANFNLLAYDVSPRLISSIPTQLTVSAPGIRGVRVTQSDGVTFDNFLFNDPVPLPEPSGLVVGLMVAVAGYSCSRISVRKLKRMDRRSTRPHSKHPSGETVNSPA